MRTETLNVTGMTCEGCTGKLTQTLNAIAGVHEVTVSLSSGEAVVRYDELQTAPAQLKSAVIGAGYGVDATNASQIQRPKGGCCG